MKKSKVNNIIFGAAPAVMFVCSAASSVVGAIGFIVGKSSVARATMNIGIAGMALSLLINRWDTLVETTNEKDVVVDPIDPEIIINAN